MIKAWCSYEAVFCPVILPRRWAFFHYLCNKYFTAHGLREGRCRLPTSHSTLALGRIHTQSQHCGLVISSIVFVPTIPHTPVKVDYSLVHTMCAGLNGKVLT